MKKDPFFCHTQVRLPPQEAVSVLVERDFARSPQVL
jgi:hypothetical protein